MSPTKTKCPCCGHPYQPASWLDCLPPVQRAVFEAIYNAGQIYQTRQEIMDKVYANAGDKAPESLQVITMHIRNINRKIKAFDLQIVGHPGGYGYCVARHRATINKRVAAKKVRARMDRLAV